MTRMLQEALRAGQSTLRPVPAVAASTIVVAGGGGVLGSAVLERVLARRQFLGVRVLVSQPLRAAMPGLETIDFAGPQSQPPDQLADLALVVFDAKRHANGREAAFVPPDPSELVALSKWLRLSGVRDLLVVMPHRAASLPQALKSGLANLDEHAIVEIGFERVAFVRSAQAPTGERSGQWLQRVADSVLAQLRIMTPQPDQPVRAAKVAEFVVQLAARLPGAPAGTRVVAPELVWLAAQHVDSAALVEAWLAGKALPEPSAVRKRM